MSSLRNRAGQASYGPRCVLIAAVRQPVSVDHAVDGRINELKVERMSESMRGWMDGWVDWMHGWMDGSVDEWTGSVDEWTGSVDG